MIWLPNADLFAVNVKIRLRRLSNQMLELPKLFDFNSTKYLFVNKKAFAYFHLMHTMFAPQIRPCYRII